MSQPTYYFFGDGQADGSGSMKDVLGGKGAGLAEMNRIGLPVPPGFTIPTRECLLYFDNRGDLRSDLRAGISEAIEKVSDSIGARFGDADNPLLVSVRSGARQSMPGMMDTILNVGLNGDTLKGLIDRTGDRRFAYDSYRRFIQMFGNVVLSIDHFYFEEVLDDRKRRRGVESDQELDADDLAEIVDAFKEVVEEHSEHGFPESPSEQLERAIRAVFESWHNDRAISYREENRIPHDWGTAVNVQAMVFGNMGDDSATGVAFTRDPSTGERIFYGEFLPNAQGEDIVSGTRTPRPLVATEDSDGGSLEESMPEAFSQLEEIRERLEAHYRDMQDIEFTIQQGKVWMLQTRTAKRTAAATVRVAVDMVSEGMIDRDEALLRVQGKQISRLLHPQLDPEAERELLATGLPASPGGATGQIVFTAEQAEQWAEQGRRVLLVRRETSPEDIRGMSAAEGILTSRGGMTSHAAVVARQMGKPCVVGCRELEVDAANGTLKIGDETFETGDLMTIDGGEGTVFRGEIPRALPELTEQFETLLRWADERRVLRVRANADNGSDAELARRYGAEGIGLTRTEHMFFEGDRINLVRRLILARNADERREAIAALRPLQTEDFTEIFRAMDGLPVTIRLLDPPLHEFLPTSDEEIAAFSEESGIDEAEIRRLVHHTSESNPMLGHRGCRLGITFPEIYEMQVEAVLDATCRARREGIEARPEIMIPLVGLDGELEKLRGRAAVLIDDYRCDGLDVEVPIGTMIELPRACLTADEIAAHADFFSFGTNDLTQTCLGISRDDANSFMPAYLAEGILTEDPFAVIDRRGTGALMEIACERGRSARSDLKIGLCGEHGGEPESIDFCHALGLDYVSCSPMRVPVARLAAAQAAIRDDEEDSE